MTGWKMIIILLIIISIALAFIFTINKFWKEKVRKEMKLRREWQKCAYDLEKEIKHYKHMSDDLLRQCDDLVSTCKELRYKMNSYMTLMSNDDILYAIKYAMIHSHPDKGGKEEDFIRFHALYEKIKNK